jgi:hypothetical protein
MVTLEQVRQLETKIGKAIDYINRANSENARLRGELDGSEKRAAELEDTVRRFREEQGRIEEGILAALDRLDQFEDIVSQGFSNVQAVVAAAAPAPGYADPGPAKPAPVAAAPLGEDPSGGTLGGETPADEGPGDEESSPDSDEAGGGEFDLF